MTIFLVAYILAAFGLWYIVGRARVSLRFRSVVAPRTPVHPLRIWFVDMLECPACCGYWIGSLATWPIVCVAELPLSPPVIFGLSFLIGFFTVATNLMLYAATRTALDSLEPSPTETK